MPERLHPGVYVEEVRPAILTIEGAGTSTAAFIGIAERGPVGRAAFITSFAEYRRIFGGYRSDSFLTYAVQSFFDNGGKKAYVVRTAAADAKTADIVLRDRERAEIGTTPAERTLAMVAPAAISEPSLSVQASSAGVWGNLIDVEVQDGTRDPVNEFKLLVKQQDEIVETFDNISMSLGDENYVENLLGPGQSAFIQAARLAAGTTDTPPAMVSGVLDADAQRLDNVADTPVLAITLNGVAAPKIVLSKPGNNTGPKVAAEIQAKVRLAAPPGTAGELLRAFQNFECTFVAGANPRYVLVSGSDTDPRTIAVPAAAVAAGEGDVRARLKLDVAAAGANQAVAVAGKALMRGISQSGNEPATLTNGSRNLSFNLNGDGFQTVQLDSGLAGGDAIADNIAAKVQGIQLQRKDPANQNAYANFSAVFDARYELTFGDPVGAAGTFAFVASPNAAKDWSTDARLRLRAATAGSETTYAGSAAPPLTVSAGLDPRDRAIVSGRAKNVRALTDLSGIADGELRLQVTPPAAAAINLDITLPGNGPATGGAVAAALQAAVRAKASDPSIAALPNVRAALSGFSAQYVSAYTLTSGDVRLTDAAGAAIGPLSSVEVLPSLNADIAPSLKLGVINGGIERTGAAALRPANGEYHVGDHFVGGAVFSVQAGSDGSSLGDLDYLGDAPAGTGLHALDKVTDVSLITIPGVGSKQVVGGGFGYCANRPLLDCFFIGDIGGPPATDPAARSDVPLVATPTDARDYVRGLPTKNDFGAVYFPWLQAADPIGVGKNPRRTLPPSGFVAGMYARTDARRGVFKAPAGTETNLAGVLGLAANISDTEQDILNPIGINVIRSFPASGTVIWGTRTLSADSAYRYVPVRRTAIFLRVSIYNGIQFAVFEPNDDDLWATLRLTIGAFMLNQFRAGAFQGTSPDKAFFVKCDATTTLQEDIDAGVVNILVGFAPLKPAEFVVLKLTQKTAQTT